jgi:hypothetical protein
MPGTSQYDGFGVYGVAGASSLLTVTPVVTASTPYSAGYCVGGFLTFGNIFRSIGRGILVNAFLGIGAIENASFSLYLLSAPLSGASSVSDNAAPTIAIADASKFIGLPIALATYVNESAISLYEVTAIQKIVRSTDGTQNLYGYVTTASALTNNFTTTNALTVGLGVLLD